MTFFPRIDGGIEEDGTWPEASERHLEQESQCKLPTRATTASTSCPGPCHGVEPQQHPTRLVEEAQSTLP
eukprot:CAMPEP_0172903032 /NCGR_PEP_ID=MMETSP1075-20121228/169611_1 /TAXON_ID=2916 /ORGANISM="Ceratium fusus, Strain PA161109" /LENGTH=69 /DNA_ID=CAMNT_0013759747 /DNA_START=1 /DNA_END=206 /DNA_ORIENTATION=-